MSTHLHHCCFTQMECGEFNKLRSEHLCPGRKKKSEISWNLKTDPYPQECRRSDFLFQNERHPHGSLKGCVGTMNSSLRLYLQKGILLKAYPLFDYCEAVGSHYKKCRPELKQKWLNYVRLFPHKMHKAVCDVAVAACEWEVWLELIKDSPGEDAVCAPILWTFAPKPNSRITLGAGYSTENVSELKPWTFFSY